MDFQVTGIDVSHWQGEIDWDAVGRTGVQFAFIKATEGATWTDPSFARNRAEARRVGIASGAYHFFRATSKVSAQVEHFARTVGEVTKGELPPVLDVEDPGQWKGMSRAGLTELVVEWLEGVQTALGAPPFVYLSPSFAEGLLDQESKPLARFPLWVAHWTDKEPRVPKPWTKWTFWQYSSKGHVDGITANVVDLDRFHGSDKDFRWLLR